MDEQEAESGRKRTRRMPSPPVLRPLPGAYMHCCPLPGQGGQPQGPTGPRPPGPRPPPRFRPPPGHSCQSVRLQPAGPLPASGNLLSSPGTRGPNAVTASRSTAPPGPRNYKHECRPHGRSSALWREHLRQSPSVMSQTQAVPVEGRDKGEKEGAISTLDA